MELDSVTFLELSFIFFTLGDSMEFLNLKDLLFALSNEFMCPNKLEEWPGAKGVNRLPKYLR